MAIPEGFYEYRCAVFFKSEYRYTGIYRDCHFFDIFDNFLTFLSFFPKIFFQYLPNFFPHVLVSVPYVLKYVINTIIPNHIAIFLTFLTVFVNFYHFFDIFWRLFRLKITKNILRYPGIILQIPVRYLGQKRVRYPGIWYTGIPTLHQIAKCLELAIYNNLLCVPR